MSGYGLTRSAERDITDIWDHVSEDNLDAADRLLDRFYERFRLLAANPHLGPVHPQLDCEIRHAVVGVYVILYEPSNEGVLILRVLHGRRDIPQVFRDEPLDEEETS